MRERSGIAVMAEGFFALSCFMGLGFLLEALLGYKIPSYLGDPLRRELFRLAHVHGAALSMVLILAGLASERVPIPTLSIHALRAALILMPLGFLGSGVVHPEGDPGLMIWLVPPGALCAVGGGLQIALACRNVLRGKDRRG